MKMVLRPVDDKFHISSEFGEIDKGLRDNKPHKGVDFATPLLTPAKACFDGTIFYLKLMKDCTTDSCRKAGNHLAIVSDGEPKYLGLYFHLDSFLCEVGQKVKTGDVVALTGNTGNSTGPHLHFELRELNSNISIKPEFDNAAV